MGTGRYAEELDSIGISRTFEQRSPIFAEGGERNGVEWNGRDRNQRMGDLYRLSQREVNETCGF